MKLQKPLLKQITMVKIKVKYLKSTFVCNTEYYTNIYYVLNIKPLRYWQEKL